MESGEMKATGKFYNNLFETIKGENHKLLTIFVIELLAYLSKTTNVHKCSQKFLQKMNFTNNRMAQ
jgi:hypothetical protein